jgi:SAM-dependent methyltransferase
MPEFGEFHRIASDCKPWPPGGALGVCGHCGCAQAVIDAAWHSDIKQIYAGYAPYYQSAGAEQSVFDQSGAATSRSIRLVSRLHAEAPLAAEGRLLDIGCGNGALLRSFSRTFTGWTLAGLDVHDHLRPVIEGIERVEHLYTCPLEEVPGRFQLVSLIHVLEHIESPRDYLVSLRDKLEPSGLVLIQVPDCEQNPFVLMVADHASHFFLPVLKRIVESAGYEVIIATNNWVAKELTIVARKGTGTPRAELLAAPRNSDAALLRRNQEWLKRLVQQGRTLAARRPFGLFGSSIAASWLANELRGSIDFFLDEDPNRPGHSFFGCPILHPNQAPAGARVLIALQPAVAGEIARRMQTLGLNAEFHIPEPLPTVAS